MEMGNSRICWMAFFILVVGFHSVMFGFRILKSQTKPSGVVKGSFVESMHFNWGIQNSEALVTGDDVQLVLDQTSGSGIESNGSFLFGSFEMLIKLPTGDSAGTITAYYLSSSGGEKHDEIDFEFLGNVSGHPYTIHTNIFTQGGGGREQQFKPWFDPTADYHNYTIHWNPSHVVWYVDDIPIRVYKNYENETIPYPNQQAMKVYSSIWNGDSWATRSGLDKIDWTKAPFIAKLRRFRARACDYDKTLSISQCAESTPPNWWSSPPYIQLSYDELDQMNLIRNESMIYDYCKDFNKFNGLFPGDCFKAQY